MESETERMENKDILFSLSLSPSLWLCGYVAILLRL
jgi:hypothetical protein